MSWLIGRVLFPATPRDATADDHPSRRAVTDALQQPTRVLGRAALERTLSGLAPGGVYRAATVARRAGGLLHHRFTLTSSPKSRGGLFSVALSRGLPRVGVTHHLALWSPDLPRQACDDTVAAVARPAHPRDQANAGSRAIRGG